DGKAEPSSLGSAFHSRRSARNEFPRRSIAPATTATFDRTVAASCRPDTHDSGLHGEHQPFGVGGTAIRPGHDALDSGREHVAPDDKRRLAELEHGDEVGAVRWTRVE